MESVCEHDMRLLRYILECMPTVRSQARGYIWIPSFLQENSFLGYCIVSNFQAASSSCLKFNYRNEVLI